MYLHY